MTLEQLQNHSWIYSEASRNWFLPRDRSMHVHLRIYRAYRSPKKPFIKISGVENVACIYNSLDKTLPKDHLPNGVFTTLYVVDTNCGNTYYVFTDVEQLYR